jgi:Rrf2 family protein
MGFRRRIFSRKRRFQPFLLPVSRAKPPVEKGIIDFFNKEYYFNITSTIRENMKLSTQSRYGVRAVVDIAYNAEGAEAQVKDISRRQGISPRYLEQIFQKLKRAGILGSKRGPGGGYSLAKKPEEITVWEVVRTTEGHLDPVPCINPKSGDRHCERADKCVTRVIWTEAGDRLKAYLDSVTIRDLCEMAQKMGVKKELDERLVYYI